MAMEGGRPLQEANRILGETGDKQLLYTSARVTYSSVGIVPVTEVRSR
jgi:hypothetical protein